MFTTSGLSYFSPSLIRVILKVDYSAGFNGTCMLYHSLGLQVLYGRTRQRSMIGHARVLCNTCACYRIALDY